LPGDPHAIARLMSVSMVVGSQLVVDKSAEEFSKKA
jgi:hypothetical protein